MRVVQVVISLATLFDLFEVLAQVPVDCGLAGFLLDEGTFNDFGDRPGIEAGCLVLLLLAFLAVLGALFPLLVHEFVCVGDVMFRGVGVSGLHDLFNKVVLDHLQFLPAVKRLRIDDVYDAIERGNHENSSVERSVDTRNIFPASRFRADIIGGQGLGGG